MRQYMGTIHRGKFSGGQFSVGQITKGTQRNLPEAVLLIPFYFMLTHKMKQTLVDAIFMKYGCKSQ